MGKIEISPNLFRTLDIRGANEEFVNSQHFVEGSPKSKSAFGTILNTEIAVVIGKSIAVAEKPKKVVVGYDARLSSPELSKALIKGFLSQGVDVDLIGLVTTDKLYFAIGEYKYDLGVMTTASHSTKELNGFKISRLVDGRVMPVADGTGMEAVKKIALEQDFAALAGKGEFREIDISDDFTKYILSYFDLTKIAKQKVVFDAANGPAGITHEKIIDSLPIEAIKLNFTPDGNFPNHEPNPMIPRNVSETVNVIKSEGADFGVAWDGDADRVAIITKKGDILTGSFIAPLLIPWVIDRHPGATIINTPPMSWASRDLAEKYSDKIKYSRVGNSYVKQAMAEEKSPFAAEEADHFMFAETFYAESGILPVLIVLQSIFENHETFDDLVASVVKNYHVSGDINFTVKNSQKIIETVRQEYLKIGGKISEIDGIEVDFSDWHFCLRPSLNDPVIRLNIETTSSEKIASEIENIKKIIVEADK
ncbi:MAG: phosphomannomutase/phosphoglucomutase [Candidatus Berkelbacteria bacterium]